MRAARQRGAAVLAATALTLSLAACGEDEEPEPLQIGKDSPSASDTAEAEQDDELQLEYPDRGISFTNPPTTKDKAKQAAWAAYVRYTAAGRKAVTTAKWNPAASKYGSGATLEALRDNVKSLKKRDRKYGGDVVYRFERFRGARGQFVGLETCIEGQDATIVKANGKTEGFDPSTVNEKIDVQFVEGSWKVTSTENEEPC